MGERSLGLQSCVVRFNKEIYSVGVGLSRLVEWGKNDGIRLSSAFQSKPIIFNNIASYYNVQQVGNRHNSNAASNRLFPRYPRG